MLVLTEVEWMIIVSGGRGGRKVLPMWARTALKLCCTPAEFRPKLKIGTRYIAEPR